MSQSPGEWSALPQWRAAAARVQEVERRAMPAPGTTVAGECPICGGRFHVDIQPGLDLREGLLCGDCHCNARQRAAAIVLLEELHGRDGARVYATEQATPFYIALRRRLPGLRGSEYVRALRRRLRLSLWLWRNGLREWLRFADLTDLSFGDASRDAIISLDVLEHVPDHCAALRECARVLETGGVLVLTVPFYEDNLHSRALARVRADGSIEYLAQPEYHGDPVSGGVLCFHHFGWELLHDMREAGFSEAVARRVHAPQAVVPLGQWVLVARR